MANSGSNPPPGDLDKADDQRFADLEDQLDRLWPDSSQPVSPLVGRRIAHYDLKRVLGSGAFGVVYLAEDTKLGREVALKLPRPEVLVDVDKRERFSAEASFAAGLEHPGIVPIYHAELEGPTPYLVSAYCDGPDLAEWLEAHGPASTWQEAVAFVAEVAEALEYANSQGVYHRDLKPANLVLAPKPGVLSSSDSLSDFEPRITDFGLAKLADARLTDTRSSLLVGTPLYMAPEQIDRTINDSHPAATDLYSLGVILYQLLTGRTPVEGDNYVEVLDRIRTSSTEPLRAVRKDLPRDLERICRRCLQHNPAARYESPQSLVDDLQRCLTSQPIAGKPLNPLQGLFYWASRPDRIQQAGWFTVWTQTIWVVWLIFTGSVGHIFTPMNVVLFRDLLVEFMIVLFAIHGLCLAVGWFIVKGHRWAAWAGLVLSPFQIPGMILSIINGPLIFDELYQGVNQYYAFLIYCMLLTCFSVQAFLSACAIAAHLRRGRSASCRS